MCSRSNSRTKRCDALLRLHGVRLRCEHSSLSQVSSSPRSEAVSLRNRVSSERSSSLRRSAFRRSQMTTNCVVISQPDIQCLFTYAERLGNFSFLSSVVRAKRATRYGLVGRAVNAHWFSPFRGKVLSIVWFDRSGSIPVGVDSSIAAHVVASMFTGRALGLGLWSTGRGHGGRVRLSSKGRAS